MATQSMNPKPIETLGQPTRRVLIALYILIGVGFLMAGGARDDIISLLIWRPLSILLLATALLWGWRNGWWVGPFAMGFTLALIAFVALNLVPLPPSIWTALPGREQVAAIYREANAALPWLPISLAPARTWNALFALAAPFAALLLVFLLRGNDQVRLARFVLGIGMVSGLVGLLQAIGPDDSLLYFYRITNEGQAVGLFANRNHQAALLSCLFPLLAAVLALQRTTPDSLPFYRLLTVAAALFLIPLLLVTGSRSGVVLGLLGLGGAFWVYQPPVATGRAGTAKLMDRRVQMVSVGGAGLFVAIMTVVASRAESIRRLIESDPSDDLRLAALPVIWSAAWDYFPVGSGVGSFVEVYKIVEPYDLLSPAYLNHAHNEPLEVLMTGGAIGVVFMVCAAAALLVAIWRLHRGRSLRAGQDTTANVLARAGAVICMLLALASVADYPLRVPSLAILFTIAVAWISNALGSKSPAKMGLS